LPGTAQATLSVLADTSMRDQANGRTKRSTKSSIAAGQLACGHSNCRVQTDEAASSCRDFPL
jgi:hypothetical protein